MKSVDSGKKVSLGLSLLSIAFVLAGAACGNSDGGGTNMNGVNGAGFGGSAPLAGAPAPPKAGNAAPVVTGNGGAAAGMGGVKPAGGAGGAGGMVTPPPMGGAGMTGGAGGGGMTGGAGGGDVGGMGGAGGMGGMAGGGTAGTTGSGDSACLDGDTDFGKDGKFQFKTEDQGSVHFWVPMVPAGCKVPVVHLANGTGATCSAYTASLTRLASHGFLTCCYENPNTGAGDQGVMAFQAALDKYPDLAAMKFGSTGHSQGGQASFTVLALAEKKWGDKAIYAGLAMEPASGFGSQPVGTTWQALYKGIKSPFFMFSGVGTDGLVSQGWVQQAFDALDAGVEAYFWAKNGATHIPVPNGEEQEISIPWFRWKLLGDQAACKAFKAIPMTNTAWVVVDTKNEKACM